MATVLKRVATTLSQHAIPSYCLTAWHSTCMARVYSRMHVQCISRGNQPTLGSLEEDGSSWGCCWGVVLSGGVFSGTMTRPARPNDSSAQRASCKRTLHYRGYGMRHGHHAMLATSRGWPYAVGHWGGGGEGARCAWCLQADYRPKLGPTTLPSEPWEVSLVGRKWRAV